MTNITSSELKILYIEIIIVSIIGVFLLLYSHSPITQTATSGGTLTNTSTLSSPMPWSTTLVDSTLGLPVGLSAIIIVSSIFLVPMTIMNSLVIIRLAKDFVTQWL